MEAPIYFRDEMKKGIFKRFTHDHYFETIERKTKMYEVFEYESPFGILGKLSGNRFLKSYIKRFFRNEEPRDKGLFKKRE